MNEMMKKIIPIIILATALLCGCSDRIKINTPFFVSVKSESGAESTHVLSTANNLVLQYPVNLVCTERSEDVLITFEVVPGNGLKEGVDYTLPASRTLTFSKGEYLKYIRINYLNHVVDKTKDNTVVIRLVSSSDPDIVIGYPGPSKKFSTHTITKIND